MEVGLAAGVHLETEGDPIDLSFFLQGGKFTLAVCDPHRPAQEL
jgi:hypothetical protein